MYFGRLEEPCTLRSPSGRLHPGRDPGTERRPPEREEKNVCVCEHSPPVFLKQEHCNLKLSGNAHRKKITTVFFAKSMERERESENMKELRRAWRNMEWWMYITYISSPFPPLPFPFFFPFPFFLFHPFPFSFLFPSFSIFFSLSVFLSLGFPLPFLLHSFHFFVSVSFSWFFFLLFLSLVCLLALVAVSTSLSYSLGGRVFSRLMLGLSCFLSFCRPSKLCRIMPNHAWSVGSHWRRPPRLRSPLERLC